MSDNADERGSSTHAAIADNLLQVMGDVTIRTTLSKHEQRITVLRAIAHALTSIAKSVR